MKEAVRCSYFNAIGKIGKAAFMYATLSPGDPGDVTSGFNVDVYNQTKGFVV